MRMIPRQMRLAGPLALALFTLDCTSKQLAETHLAPEHVPYPVIGDLVRFTLAYNTEAAMGIPLGPHPRPILAVSAVFALAILLRLLTRTAETAVLRQAALGLILGGALGNLLSRVFSPNGVVDFIDLGVGTSRFYVFNVADIGVCCGAIILAWTLWREETATPAQTV
jgi:signal peptidase II